MEIKRITNFLSHVGWVTDIDEIAFLAAGEYNENYLVKTARATYVFRINHGSQLGLDNQAEYEFTALSAVEPSGVTPKPYRCLVGQEVAECELGDGVLLMDFIPGGAFEYRRDWKKAAAVFSAIHKVPVSSPQAGKLISQNQPVLDIANECHTLLHRFPDHPLQKEQARLLDYHDEVLRLAEETRDQFKTDRLCIVNTEVNSGNFIVDGNVCSLVDWEKAVVSYRYQDLGHFLVPTTTLWKTSFTFSEELRLDFLREYAAQSDLDLSIQDISELTLVLEKTILLRGLSWCYMAYYEYVQQDRSLKNDDTFRTIEKYMDEIEWFLRNTR